VVRQVRKERSNADIEGGVRLSASGDIDARARCMLTLLFVSSIALAQQQPDSLTALQQAAEQRTSEWDGLARTLEGKIARMLPCDARVRTTIEEVNRASDARLAALGKYLKPPRPKQAQHLNSRQELWRSRKGWRANWNWSAPKPISSGSRWMPSFPNSPRV